MNSQVEQERVAIEKAIKATEYKYFGDYEFSNDQREAVDTLVAAAQARLASLASQPPVLDEREVKRAFTFAFAVGFQWASECSCVSAASIDEAWSEYTAIRNLGGPDDVA